MFEKNLGKSGEEVEYPAEFHFRVVCDAKADVKADICSAAAAHMITGQLKESNNSSSGRFISYSISVLFEEREGMVRFDETVKAIPGVRMLL